MASDSLVEEANAAALCASKCVTSSWVVFVAELQTIWSAKTERKNPAAIMACEVLANLSYQTRRPYAKREQWRAV